LSLRIKVFLFSVALAILPLALGFAVVCSQLSQAGERSAREDLRISSASVEQLMSWSGDRLRVEAALLARSPQLAVEPLDAATAADLQAPVAALLGAPTGLVAVVRSDGALVSLAGSVEPAAVTGALQAPPVSSARAGTAGSGLWRLDGRLFQVAAQPVFRPAPTPRPGSPRPPDDTPPVAVLLLGREIGGPFAAQLGGVEHSQMALFVEGTLIGSSLEPERAAQLAAGWSEIPAGASQRLLLGEEEYLVARHPMPLVYGGGRSDFVFLESLAATRQITRRVSGLFSALGLATLLGALLIAWAGSHRLTAPLRESARRMAEMARTGDLETAPPADGGPEVASFQRTFRQLIDTLRQSQEERERSYIETVGALVIAIDARDNDTTGHSFRVARYARCLGARLDMQPEELRALEWGALLHDIGKIAVPDAVLRKAGPLTEEEWHIMHQHPTWGVEMLADVSFLRPALGIIQYHQERWDGLGYPHGLEGDEIPLGARLFAVIDTYDAITSDRPYRRAGSHAEALAELRRVAGVQLDPEIVEVFAQIPEEELRKLDQVRRRG
jgi:putative nucleotidyltransferase with HDIG domain